MNIFKLLGFRKKLFCFFKACLIMAFKILFLKIEEVIEIIASFFVKNIIK